MKKILFIFTFFISSLCIAQNDEAYVDALASQKMAELEMQQNPLYFSRKNYCEGNVQMFVMPDGKHCASKSTYYAIYVFWKESEEIMKFQKFDNCGSFNAIPIGISKSMKKIFKENASLRMEEVKPFESEKTDSNPYDNMTVKDCHMEYNFVFSGETFAKNFSEYDLKENSKYENLNADHNNALMLIKLEKEISEMINHFETNGKFFREK